MLTAAAPMPSTPELNAPRQAQKQAVRGRRPMPEQSVTVAPPPPSVDFNPNVVNAEMWKALLDSDPVFDDPIVRWYADEAGRRAGA